MHKSKEMTVEQLIVRLRIEEDNRRSEKRNSSIAAKPNVNAAKANIVEHEHGSKKYRKPLHYPTEHAQHARYTCDSSSNL